MLSIKELIKSGPPRGRVGIPSGIFFSNITEEILGEHYELSLVVCGNALSRKLNRTYRGKDYPTNVLSFGLDKNSGEIFINLLKVRQECPQYDRSLPEHLIALFIHGALHLKGFNHGSTMESTERKLIDKFSIKPNAQSNRHRSRYRNGNHPRGRVRVQGRK